MMAPTSGFGANRWTASKWATEVAVPVLSMSGALGYLGLAMGLSRTEALSFLYAALCHVVVAALMRSQFGPVEANLISDRLDAANAQFTKFRALDPSSGVRFSATDIGSLWSLPARSARDQFLSLLSAAVVMPIWMMMLGFEGWFRIDSLQHVSLACLAAGCTAGMAEFYTQRRSIRDRLSDVRLEASPEAQKSAPPASWFSFNRGIQVAVVVPALIALGLIVNLNGSERQTTAEDAALDWAHVAIAGVLEGDPGLDLRQRIDAQRATQNIWPVPISLVAVAMNQVTMGNKAPVAEDMITAMKVGIKSGAGAGDLTLASSRQIGAYQRINDDTTLVAFVPRTGVRGALAPWRQLSLVLFGLCIAVLLAGCGAMVGRDLSEALATARAAADRIALGDIRSRPGLRSNDEFGELGRSLDRVGLGFHTTAEKVTFALDHVERVASEAIGIAAGFSAGSIQQTERLERVRDLVRSIGSQGVDVSHAAGALNESIDDSSSSIAELGAAGAELNQTASVLSDKVDDVSGSMEQLVRSVKQVSVSTEKLSGASEDTSSSMEEMASAMRLVDTSAESMANLSRDVVSKAEMGQAKVCQTIEGMDAIREATDVAERVIRGLGVRTSEIGGILDVIDDVADETNLLALNAAIIAAQAGEQGRAFSVVADEIKQLADRVLASTKEIGGLIRSVQEESENAIGAIEAGTMSVMSGVDLSAEAGKTLEEITDASRDSGLRIGEIVASVREQTKAAGHVVELMERVRDSADEISEASAEQDRGNELIYRSVLTMREVALQVRHTTEEQSTGFGRIRESVEGVRTVVERISDSLGMQGGACGEVEDYLTQVSEENRSNDDAAVKLSAAMKQLLSQTEVLREDVERYQNS